MFACRESGVIEDDSISGEFDNFPEGKVRLLKYKRSTNQIPFWVSMGTCVCQKVSDTAACLCWRSVRWVGVGFDTIHSSFVLCLFSQSIRSYYSLLVFPHFPPVALFPRACRLLLVLTRPRLLVA